MSDITMRRLPDDTHPEPGKDPRGTFAWRIDDDGIARRMMYICPDRRLCAVPIAPKTLPNGATWQWDGNEDTPTLSPSINCVGGCKWHGHIQAGIMK